ncbi:SDR family NAD(P)-dependent oxidoreductase [uncultured Mucilaginibacter sp.]|uniref:SDR family NAD(P)-dependent oxidoreductase n=1 Tax=uncultured Mucilaginibacter sp. TaxID=797541 RepID=UPI0026189DFD|nr:SDR family NAD(P)-dependent oxidoreductase [uncultured Mucilaginibacter sp.]
MENKKVWFVTGASKGLGLALVKKLLSGGYKVAATSRNSNALVKEIGEQSADFLPLEVDLVNEVSVQKAIETTLVHFKTIDVLVNNAGYGQIGTLEELTDKAARANFDTNVFGLLNVVRHVMPHFRAAKSGHIFNISSIAGYNAGFAGWGIYCATKFAVAGLTESLAAETKAFGIKVTLVYPGYFRTDFLSKGSIVMPANAIAEYEEARQSQELHQNQIAGNQSGDPEKAALALIQMSNEQKPALHLFLGQDALDLANQKIDFVKADLENWKEVSTSTSFN